MGGVMSSRYLKSGKWEVEVDKLLLKVEALEKRIYELEGGDPPNPWSQFLIPYGRPSDGPSPYMSGIWQNLFGSGSDSIVIDCGLSYMESLPSEILDEIRRREQPEAAYSTCVAVRFQLQNWSDAQAALLSSYQENIPVIVHDWWTKYAKEEEASLREIVRGEVDEGGLVRRIKYSELSYESELQKAMEDLFKESTLHQHNVVTMICRMSIKPGAYIRLHLSKGWSHFLKQGMIWGADDSSVSDPSVWIPSNYAFEVAAINPMPEIEGMSINMRVQFSSGKDGLRVKLPSWFKPLSRDGGFEERRLFIGKVTRVFEDDDNPAPPPALPESPRSWSIKNGIIAQWNRRKGTKGLLRNELRCVGREFSDIDLPATGMFDLELQL
jgi:hypothetical protein